MSLSTAAADTIPISIFGYLPIPPMRLLPDRVTRQSGLAVKWSSGAEGTSNGLLNTGGRYCVPSGIPTPTPAPTPCPGGYAVCNGNDSGAGSLRRAILYASSGDTITFAPSVTTVTLINGELVINKNLIITGPGANRLTVTARCIDFVCFRIFNISPGVTVSISGITISNGDASGWPRGRRYSERRRIDTYRLYHLR